MTSEEYRIEWTNFLYSIAYNNSLRMEDGRNLLHNLDSTVMKLVERKNILEKLKSPSPFKNGDALIERISNEVIELEKEADKYYGILGCDKFRKKRD